MFLRALILSTLLAFSAYAQEEHNYIQVIPSDTVRLNDSLPMFSRIDAPKVYTNWLIQIVECEHLTMPPQNEVDDLKFYFVNTNSFSVAPLVTQYNAATWSREHIIVISYPYLYDYRIVAHELLHFVLWYNYGSKYVYTNQHPEEYFRKCNIRPF